LEPASLHESEILKACRTLFGAGVSLDRHFLAYLQPSGAKTAYRKRAKETHPDRFVGDDRMQRRQAERFHDLTRALDLLTGFFKQREKGLWPAPGGTLAPHRPTRTARRQPNSPKYPAGPLQGRTYEIGLFLYSHGLITYKALIEALVWQRSQRPSIGETARHWGWLDDLHVRTIASHRSLNRRFGEKAVELGLLTPFQVRTLLHYQRTRHQRLGRYFVDRGYLSNAQIDQLAQQMREHNARVKASAPR